VQACEHPESPCPRGMRGTDHRCEGIVNGAPGASHCCSGLGFGRGHPRGPHEQKAFEVTDTRRVRSLPKPWRCLLPSWACWWTIRGTPADHVPTFGFSAHFQCIFDFP
jgi:hypothetical protein